MWPSSEGHYMRRTLACYAEGKGNQYEAICLDLDIAIQGSSFTEVYEGLDAAIADYLEYVATLPAEEQKTLLNRRAPLVDRLRFVWHALLISLFHDGRNGKTRHEFLLPHAA